MNAATLEAVLFAAGEPVQLSDLAGVLEVSKPELRSLLADLSEALQGRGVQLVSDDRVVQLVTAPVAAPYVARLLQTELRGKLSPSALETLAVIAYKGPITRPEIEAVRGVQSAQAVRTLSLRGLIAETGRSDAPGRPIIYDVALELYKHLGISGREQLPEVEETHLAAAAAAIAED